METQDQSPTDLFRAVSHGMECWSVDDIPAGNPSPGAQMTFTKPRQLVAAALIAVVAVYLGARVGYSSLPPLPALVGMTLLLLAGVDVALAFSLRSRLKGRRGVEPPEALTAARAVALAKASSMLGALMGGAFVGLLVYVLPIRDVVEAAKSDTTSCIVGIVCSAALIGAGLWLEYCLRTPEDRDENDQQPR